MKQIIVLLMLALFVTVSDAQSIADQTIIVGTLNYGQTSGQISYKNPAKYRAFKFSGKKGDKIEVWVQSQNGDAIAFIYDNEFKRLADNDDADSTILNSHIKFTLPGADNITYYIIFREYDYSNATFVVSLKLQSDPRNIILFGGKQKKKNAITRQEANDSFLDNQPWEIKLDPTIKGIGGEISMQIPKGLGGRTHMEFFPAGDYKNRVASWFDNNKEKLLPGLYNVVIDSRDTIKNVPVELGKQTRLKMGVFSVSGYRGQTIENSTNHQKFSYGAPFAILLPEGSYYLNGNRKVPIVIKDGELTEL